MELKELCIGTESIETATSVVLSLFSLPPEADIGQLTRQHLTLAQRILDLDAQNPISIDQLIKAHLLFLLRQCPDSNSYLHVKDKCLVESVTYREANTAILTRHGRLKLQQEGPIAMVAQHKGHRSMRCLRCNSRKHLAANCPHPHVANDDSDSDQEDRKLGTPKEWGEMRRKLRQQEATIAEMTETVAQVAQEKEEPAHGFYNVGW